MAEVTRGKTGAKEGERRLSVSEAGKRGGRARAAQIGSAGYSELGKRGAATVMQRYGRRHYVEMGQASAAARLAKERHGAEKPEKG